MEGAEEFHYQWCHNPLWAWQSVILWMCFVLSLMSLEVTSSYQSKNRFLINQFSCSGPWLPDPQLASVNNETFYNYYQIVVCFVGFFLNVLI